MNCSECGIYVAKGSSRDTKKFSDTLRGGGILKYTSTHCSKRNVINICHSDIQKHVSYEKWLK